MENIKIIHILKSGDDISFIEFMQDGKSKILSLANFISRFGIDKQELNKCKI